MKKLIALLSLTTALATDFTICWDNSIPGAHVYQWTTPRINDVPALFDCYVDLGELTDGLNSFAWFDDPTSGGSVVITTPEGFLAFAEVTGSAGVGAIQVWGFGGDYGGQVFEDSVNTGWDFGVIEFGPLTEPHIMPDGFGSWLEGECPEPLAASKGKGKKLGHSK
jgi:hypothetical protein